MLERLPKIEVTADATELQQLKKIRETLEAYFGEIRAMVDIAATNAADAAAITAGLDKALAAQKIVTTAVKEYSTYSGGALAEARASALQSSFVALTIALSTAAACIVLGVVVSLLVARRGIARPVRALTAAMSRLAEGDLSSTGTDADRKDDIGEMARAVEVFRRNALAMHDMKTQEAALNALSSDLQSSISAVVAAAVAGDFTGRIGKDYHNDDLNRFAGSVNELVGSIDHASPKSAASLQRSPMPTCRRA